MALRSTHAIFRNCVYLKTMKPAIIAMLLLGGLMQAQEPKGLALKARIELPNVNGRIDHFSADVKGQRLFMAALGNHTVEVMDIQGVKRIHTIPDLAEPQGIYFDSATNRLFVACAKDGTTKIFDGGTFQLLETVKFSGDADNIRYDPRSRRIIVGYGDGALGFLDSNGKKTGEIALDAHPESLTMNRLVLIAATLIGLAGCLWPQSLRKVVTIELPGPKGQRFDYLTTDDEDHYLLSAHLGPGILYVIDLRTDKLVKAIPGVPGITGLEYIPGLHKIYTSNWGENKIGVVDLKSMSVIKRLPTADKPNGSGYAAPFRKVYVSDTDGVAVGIVDGDKDAINK